MLKITMESGVRQQKVSVMDRIWKIRIWWNKHWDTNQCKLKVSGIVNIKDDLSAERESEELCELLKVEG